MNYEKIEENGKVIFIPPYEDVTGSPGSSSASVKKPKQPRKAPHPKALGGYSGLNYGERKRWW